MQERQGSVRQVRHAGREADLSGAEVDNGDAQPVWEPGVAAIVVTFAVIQRLVLTEVFTRYQLIALCLSIALIELLVMPLLGRRPSVRSFLANAALAAGAVVTTKWALEGINWSSAVRQLLRLGPAL